MPLPPSFLLLSSCSSAAERETEQFLFGRPKAVCFKTDGLEVGWSVALRPQKP